MKTIKSSIKKILKYFNIKLLRDDYYQELVQSDGASLDIKFLSGINSEFRSDCIDLLSISQSQLRQDLFVLSTLGFKRNGYFVEFGAAGGKSLSNTYLLEKNFDWVGILSEPAKIWHDQLRGCRSSSIDFRCVWSESGESVEFNEAYESELSTISSFSFNDNHAKKRKNGNYYNVKTVSLLDLLTFHQAPSVIDYLSIDTEGSEFEILNAFDFDRFKFRVITCEHNYTSSREDIYNLLTSHGYKRVLENISSFDDWYVLEI